MQDVDLVDVPGPDAAITALGDGELLVLARGGNQQAYGALFGRYSYAAHRLARHLGQREDSEDVVAESFAQVLDLVNRGKGPETAFRAYLFTTIRHEAARRAKARQRVTPTDDEAQIDRAVDFGGGALDDFERSAIRSAYESLPPRWRTVLWHLDVEGRKPHELGPLMELSPNSVSALVYRARSGLREAYLQQHVKADGGDSRSCREVRAKLSAFVRRSASARDQERVHAHLQGCDACMAVHLDLQEVNREVGLVAVPTAVAVGAATTALGSLVGHLLLAAKGVAATLVPPAAAAALTTATIVGVATSSPLVDPPRTPLAAMWVAPEAAAATTTPEGREERQPAAPGAAPAAGPAAPAAPVARAANTATAAPSARPVAHVTTSRATSRATMQRRPVRATLTPSRVVPPADVPTPVVLDLGVVRVAATADAAPGERSTGALPAPPTTPTLQVDLDGVVGLLGGAPAP